MALVAKAFKQGIRAANPRPKIAVGNNRAVTKPKQNKVGWGGWQGKTQQYRTNSGYVKNNANVSGPGPSTPSAPSAPTQQAFGAPIDPRDASYWEMKAQLDYADRIDQEGVNAANQRAGLTKNEEIAERDYYDPREIQDTRKNSNAAGLIYSTTNQERLGELGVQQLGKRSAINRSYQEGLESRAQGLKERQGQRALEEREFYQQAIERAAQAEYEREVAEEPFALDFSGLDSILSGNISIGSGSGPGAFATVKNKQGKKVKIGVSKNKAL